MNTNFLFQATDFSLCAGRVYLAYWTYCYYCWASGYAYRCKWQEAGKLEELAPFSRNDVNLTQIVDIVFSRLKWRGTAGKGLRENATHKKVVINKSFWITSFNECSQRLHKTVDKNSPALWQFIKDFLLEGNFVAERAANRAKLQWRNGMKRSKNAIYIKFLNVDSEK